MAAQKKLSILLVDDDSGHRAMLNTLLLDWGYAVHEAEDGEKAIEMCRSQPFDLVFTDVRMAKKSGIDVLRAVKAQNPAIPVLIMTAYSTVEAAVEAIKAGAYDYLTKPLDFEKLQETIQNIFESCGLAQKSKPQLSPQASSAELPNIIAESSLMRQLLEMVQTVAPSDATVLITGESGTGKELIAKLFTRTARAGKARILLLTVPQSLSRWLNRNFSGTRKALLPARTSAAKAALYLRIKARCFLMKLVKCLC